MVQFYNVDDFGMKVGDLVVRKTDKSRILGIVLRLYTIGNQFRHKDPLPMAEIATESGSMHWKCRKIEVINENR